MPVSENRDIHASGDVHGSARQLRAMYATRLMTEIYHLVQPSGHYTLCGLRVSRITSERKANTLQLVSELSGNFTICKHCDRIRNQDVREMN
jgi:hypothetical protein